MAKSKLDHLGFYCKLHVFDRTIRKFRNWNQSWVLIGGTPCIMPKQESHIFQNKRTLYETGSNKRLLLQTTLCLSKDSCSWFIAVSDMLSLWLIRASNDPFIRRSSCIWRKSTHGGILFEERQLNGLECILWHWTGRKPRLQ